MHLLRGRAIPAWLLLILALAAGGCASPAADSESTGATTHNAGSSTERPNILLISLDALRADHLSCYGYERSTSPFLDELAAAGQLFSRAYVNTHGTPPSHTTILTSLYQETHRVGTRPLPDQPRNDAVPRGVTMVQEILRENGYRTLAVTDGGFMARTFGFDRGFEEYFDRGQGVEDGRRELLEMIRRTDARPIFALFHTYQVHSPYQPPEEYRSLFGEFPSEFEPTNDNLLPIQDDAWSRLSPADVEFLKAMYDGEIRYTDDVLRGLFDELEGEGFLDNTLVIVTSDHGEEFADHGGLLHRVSLYEELLHVPLILYGRGVPAGKVDRRLASSIDIAPTILAAAGLEPLEIMEGIDLLAPPQSSRSAVYSQYTSLKYSLVTPRWKLIESPAKRRVELYDLVADPGETKNLADEEPERTRRLLSNLRSWRASRPELTNLEPGEVEIPPEEAERLRALGYVD